LRVKSLELRKTIVIFMFFICLFITSPAFASPAKSVSEGNKLYHQKKYDEAEKKYNEAKSGAPDSDIVNYNLGAALYKQGRYQEAADAFTKAALSKDKKLEAKTTYNIGNSKFKLGSLQEDTAPNSAVDLYRESIDYYNRALEIDKNDKDTKYNQELVKKRLKALLEKLKNQPQQQKQGQDKKDKQDKQENNKSQSKAEQEKQEDKKQQKSEQKQSEAAGDKDKQTAQGKNDKTGQGSTAGEKTKRMSPEEARLLLEAYRAEEAAAEHERKGRHEEVLKDW
jgi:Ca-activated chloride channel homolog